VWLSGQHKRPAEYSEGQTGTVTIGGDKLAVLLDSERRGVEVYGPAGYRWTPKAGERVLVIQGKGEIPAVVGTRQGDYVPEKVAIRSDSLDLQAEVMIQGVPLDTYIMMLIASMLGGGGAG